MNSRIRKTLQILLMVVTTAVVLFIVYQNVEQVNDEQGHEAGDSFIRRAAQQIVAVFPEHTYRIGGDEFVVVYPDVLEVQFEFLLSQLKLNTRQHHISLSIGAIWKEECDALDALLKEADAKMYEDKKKYYEKKGHDRRRNSRPEVSAAETQTAKAPSAERKEPEMKEAEEPPAERKEPEMKEAEEPPAAMKETEMKAEKAGEAEA